MANDESQAIEGYGCICGYVTDDLAQFQRHMLDGGRKDGKGVHKSKGRINMSTGEVVMPPWEERNKEQIDASRVALRKDPKPKDKAGVITAVVRTDNVGEASEMKFVPRVYTTTLSPLLQTAYVAAREPRPRGWGWRKDMPFANFLDTVIYNYFDEHGTKLMAWINSEDREDGGAEGHGATTTLGPEDYSPPPEEEKPEPTETTGRAAKPNME
jgi:hypothetical protein